MPPDIISRLPSRFPNVIYMHVHIVQCFVHSVYDLKKNVFTFENICMPTFQFERSVLADPLHVLTETTEWFCTLLLCQFYLLLDNIISTYSRIHLLNYGIKKHTVLSLAGLKQEVSLVYFIFCYSVWLTVPKSQQFLFDPTSQRPPTQWNLRGGRWSSVE